MVGPPVLPAPDVIGRLVRPPSDDLRSAEHERRSMLEVTVRMRPGGHHARRRGPASQCVPTVRSGPWPVLLTRPPYGKNTPQVHRHAGPGWRGPARVHRRPPGHQGLLRLLRVKRDPFTSEASDGFAHRPVGGGAPPLERVSRDVRHQLLRLHPVDGRVQQAARAQGDITEDDLVPTPTTALFGARGPMNSATPSHGR